MELIVGDDGLPRCWWGTEPEIYRSYHDDEWGRPATQDHRLFEKICLEGFQSGLSWLTILRKRDAFRAAFAGFDPARVAGFGEEDVARLLDDAGIVRHQGKIRSTINNAARALELIDEAGSLQGFFWSWADPVDTAPVEIPATHRGLHGALQGAETTRVVIRRTDDRLRLHAGDGSGQRPPGGVPCQGGVFPATSFPNVGT